MYNYQLIESYQRLLEKAAGQVFTTEINESGLDVIFNGKYNYAKSYVRNKDIQSIEDFTDYLEKHMGISLTTPMTEENLKYAICLTTNKYATFYKVSHKLYAVDYPKFANTPFSDIPYYNNRTMQPTIMSSEEFRVLMNILHLSNATLTKLNSHKFIMLSRQLWTPSLLKLTARIHYRNTLHIHTNAQSIAYSILILRHLFGMADNEIYKLSENEYIFNIVRKKMKLGDSSVRDFSYLSLTRIVFNYLGFDKDSVKSMQSQLSKMNKVSLLIIDYPKNKSALEHIFNHTESSSNEIDKMLVNFNIKS